jgi:hypothetical protein
MNLPTLFIVSLLAVFDERAAVEELSACAFADGADRGGWIIVSEGTARLAVPDSFEEVPHSQSAHGGAKWADSSSSVSVDWGHWDRISFLGVRAEFCQMTCGPEAAVVADIESNDGAELALFVEPTDVSTLRPMVSVRTSSSNRAVALGVIISACELHEPATEQDFETLLPSGLTKKDRPRAAAVLSHG